MDNRTLFTSLVTDPQILKALDKMKFTEATPVQAQSIGPMSEGLDVTVQAPTGTGKTCAFSIPILKQIDPHEKMVQAIILSPTRELALQIADFMRDLATFKPGIRIATIYGGERIEKQFALLRKKPQIVVATPGRLIDHLQRKTINLSKVSMIVLDEADRMLDMGFRPDLNRILKSFSGKRQTALFSATLSPEIKAIAKSYQTDAQVIKVEQGALTVDSVEQFSVLVHRGSKNQELVALFQKEHPKLSLVFTNTKRMAEQVVTYLKSEGYKAAYLHGDLRQAQRNRVMSQYRTGRLDVLVATDVAARGIDVDNIDMVVNYDLPIEEESYVHRIGRTGRASQTGVAYTFIYGKERPQLSHLMQTTKAAIVPKDALLDPVDLELLEKTEAKARRSRSQNSRPRKQQYAGNFAPRKPQGKKVNKPGQKPVAVKPKAKKPVSRAPEQRQ